MQFLDLWRCVILEKQQKIQNLFKTDSLAAKKTLTKFLKVFQI